MATKQSFFISAAFKLLTFSIFLSVLFLFSQKNVFASEDHQATPMFSQSLNSSIKELDAKDNPQASVQSSSKTLSVADKSTADTSKSQVAFSSYTFSYSCSAWPTCAFTCSTMATCATTCSLSNCNSTPDTPSTPPPSDQDVTNPPNTTNNNTQTTTDSKDICVVVGGTKVVFDVKPVVENGRTLVPLRKIFEALGATVYWDDATQTVKGVKGNITITLVVNSVDANVNGVIKTLDVPAKIINDRVLVPARFISESMGAKVGWDEATQTVNITPALTSLETKLSGISGSLLKFSPTNSSFTATDDSTQTYGGTLALVKTNFDDVYTSSNHDCIFNINGQYTKLTTSLIFTSDKEDSIDIAFYDVDTKVVIKKLTLNRNEQNKNIDVDVTGVKNLGIKLNNIQNADTKKGYDVFYSVYPKNTLTFIDPVLSNGGS